MNPPIHSRPKPSLNDLVGDLAVILSNKKWTLALAESCTGGLLAAALTDLSGSSAWFERGYVTYSNRAKTESLGVPTELLNSYGAVSEEVAKAMAEGARKNAGVQLAIAVTGIAGPSGGTAEKPVGTVCFAWTLKRGRTHYTTVSETALFLGDRQAIRQQACAYALSEMLAILNEAIA